LNEREAADENAMRAVLQKGLKMWKETLAHLWTLSDEPHSTHASLFSEVAVGTVHHLLDVAGKITSNVGGGDVAQSSES
jgi:hypothetical protein